MKAHYLVDPKYPMVVMREVGDRRSVMAVTHDNGGAARLISALLNAKDNVIAGSVSVLENLPKMLSDERIDRDLTMQQCADQVGVASSTICRIEQGKGVQLASVVLVLQWLGRSL